MPKLGPNFFQLTVIACMKTSIALASEENFSLVVRFFKFITKVEVIQITNSADMGLVGRFFSSDIQSVHRVAEALEVGIIGF